MHSMQPSLRYALAGSLLLLAALNGGAGSSVMAQSLQSRLVAEGPQALAEAARTSGDAARGAVVFHQPTLACARCHAVTSLLPDEQIDALSPDNPTVGAVPLGPNLTELPQDATDEHLVESILSPSAKIRDGFESITIETSDGEIFAGLPVDETPQVLRLRHPLSGAIREFPLESIEARSRSTQSAMPEGQADQLTSRQQFLDLIRYLIEIRDGGAERARELQPPASMFVLQLPDYETHVDHAGLIRAWDDDALQRGEAIYQRLCINCHGDRQQPGSLPTAPRFATSELRNGADPYAMYRTLTHGFGFMVPQTWMVPRQKYDVIHYIRSVYFADREEPYNAPITDDYLRSLPAGDTFGPEPTESRPWVDMDYGPSLINTYEIPTLSDADVSPHLAYKGIAVRLDPGPGGVSRGSAWALYDHDLMSLAAAWTFDPETPQERFIDWYGIHFDGRHGAHPSLDGDVQLTSGGLPGWADPDGSWIDEARVVGRDGRRYGPLPRPWAQYRGIYHSADRTILRYTIGDVEVLESPSLLATEVTGSSETFPVTSLDQDGSTTFLRTFHIGARSQPVQLLVAVHPDRMPILSIDGATAVVSRVEDDSVTVAPEPGTFDGKTWIEVTPTRNQLDMNRDFTVVASIRTEQDGTIFCRTAPQSDWVPDGKSWFVRDGRLNYDIGWVGCVTSDRRVDDGQWHDVALSYEAETQKVTFSIDGRPAGSGNLRPQGQNREDVIRLGMTSENFPTNRNGWIGDLQGIAFYSKSLSQEQLKAFAEARRTAREASRPLMTAEAADSEPALEAAWLLDSWNTTEPVSELRDRLAGEVVRRFGRGSSSSEPLMATTIGAPQEASWSLIGADARGLALQLPAGEEPLQFAIAFRRGVADEATSQAIAAVKPIDLTTRLTGQGSRWPQILTTTSPLGDESGAFAVDVLVHPERNPWLAQTRFTGLDFFDDGDSMIVTSWDGDVWKVSGLRDGIDTQARTLTLTWRRMVSGLFQPLGVKIVEGDIYVSCRDQLAILRDADHDGEAEFVECFNSDHQVTEHFHEFAMGLQRDAAGNWYYAKSARHALTAVVPHHGTLLRVSPDGSRTDIVATGFRAANGVCLNPDGTFIVTDQEGHWNPKNRINWVREGGFYGNMFGYHDVTDASDQAMEQPLCWITNAFDRSPAELLWVDSPSWGPLHGSLLNLSYGYGKVFVVPHETIDGQVQGAMCELPIPSFPTGVMRGRFRKEDGHLYLCGMFAWAGNQTQPGGFYRLRATGRPATVPLQVHASSDTLTIVSSDPLDRERAGNPLSYSMLAWSLRRSADYGSPHLNERKWQVTDVEVSEDGRTVKLTIPDLEPTWCYELRCRWVDAEGKPAERVMHGTVHRIQE